MSGGPDNTSDQSGAPGGAPGAGAPRRSIASESLPQWTVTVGPDGARPPADAQPPVEEFSSERYSASAPPDQRAPVMQTHPQHYDPQEYDEGYDDEEPRSRRGILGLLAIGLGAILLLGLGAVGYAALTAGDDGSSDSALASEPTSEPSGERAEEIGRLLQGIGYEGIDVEQRDGTIYLAGAVESQADNAAVVTAAASLADGVPINTDGLVLADAPTDPSAPEAAPAEQVVAPADPLQRLQVRLNRTMAAKPVIFEPGTSSIAP